MPIITVSCATAQAALWLSCRQVVDRMCQQELTVDYAVGLDALRSGCTKHNLYR